LTLEPNLKNSRSVIGRHKLGVKDGTGPAAWPACVSHVDSQSDFSHSSRSCETAFEEGSNVTELVRQFEVNSCDESYAESLWKSVGYKGQLQRGRNDEPFTENS
jgi:hypothetical protein